jgi:hypothetical protein
MTVLDVPAEPDTATDRLYQMLAYRYGVRTSPDPGEPGARTVVLDPRLAREVRAAHDLWNKLVEIARRREAAVRAAWEDHPVVSPVLVELAAAKEAAEEAGRAAAAARQRAGAAKQAGIRADITAAAAAAKEAAAAAKAARDARAALAARVKALKAERRGEIAIAATEATAAYNAEIRATYDAWCQAPDGYGMYWATWNVVVADFKKAAAAVMARRVASQRAELRFHPWTGEGRLAVQLQRQNGGSMKITIPMRAADPADKLPTKGEHAFTVPVRMTFAGGPQRHVLIQQGRCKTDDGTSAIEIAVRNTGDTAATLTGVTVDLAAVRHRAVPAGRALISLPDGVIASRAPAPLITWAGLAILDAGEPFRTRAQLAPDGGKWANVLQVTDVPPAGTGRADRVRAARAGSITFRVGNAADAERVTVPATLHRLPPADADIATATFSVRTLGPDLRASVSLVARQTPAPAREEGRTVHCGWRALPSGDIRVAVILGGPPGVPAALRARRRRARPGGDVITAEQVVADRGRWHEVLIPAAWRAEADAIAAMRGERDRKTEEARRQAAAWLAARAAPGPRDDEDDLGSVPAAAGTNEELAAALAEAETARLARQEDAAPLLPTAAQVAVRGSRSLDRLAARAAAGDYGEEARELGALLAPWREEERSAWRREARARARLHGRRDDAWNVVAWWLASAGTAEVITDEWALPPLARRPEPGSPDAVQAAAARANRVLAAPGTLRQRITLTAGREGVAVTDGGTGEPGEDVAHYGCVAGGKLDRDLMRASATVTCSGCYTEVDQDFNAARHMAARARPAAEAAAVPA